MNEIRYKLNGQYVSEKVFRHNAPGIAFGDALHSNTSGWPFYSTNARVHPSQVPEAIKAARRRGVRVEFDKKGRPKFESARHQTEYLRVRGLFNMDGGYAETIPNPFIWE